MATHAGWQCHSSRRRGRRCAIFPAARRTRPVDISITAGSIEGAGTYQLGSNELITGLNNLSTTVSGVITGTGGSLVKTGSGTLTLSGINSYTGSTTVNAGTLIVDGSIAPSSLTTVNSGGTLGGTGTVGNTQINSGGVFAPGSGSAGTSMTVAGNLAFQSGALYLVQVNSSTASLANVTGTASLAGTVDANHRLRCLYDHQDLRHLALVRPRRHDIQWAHHQQPEPRRELDLHRDRRVL